MNILHQFGQEKVCESKERQKGATLVEYALIIGLISLVIVGVLATPLKDGISSFASNIQSELSGASSGDETTPQ